MNEKDTGHLHKKEMGYLLLLYKM